MTVRYYLAPYQEIIIEERPGNQAASRCLVHIRSTELAAYQVTVKAPGLDWCITAVDALLVTHTVIQSDPTISLIPFIDAGGDYLPLSATVSQVRSVSRTAIGTVLEGQGVPTDWITGATTLRAVLIQTIRQLEIAQRLGDDFPNIDLDLTVGDIPAAQRGRIINWMDANNIDRSDITSSTTVRQILRRLVQRYGWRVAMPRMLAWSEARE